MAGVTDVDDPHSRGDKVREGLRRRWLSLCVPHELVAQLAEALNVRDRHLDPHDVGDLGRQVLGRSHILLDTRTSAEASRAW
jgi:hypothetical protein